MLKDSRTGRRFPFRTSPKRLGLLVALSLALAEVGCGDEAAPEPQVIARGPQVILEVQAPVSERGTTVASLDYEIACDRYWNTTDAQGTFVPALRRDGTMELVGPADTMSGAEPPERNLWRATEQPLDGLCLVNLLGRDEEEQTICTSTETFDATEGQATLVDTVIACARLPSFAGAADIAVAIPGSMLEVDLQTVEFTVDCGGKGTAFFEGTDAQVTINGNLEVVEDAEGGGLSVWHSFVDLPTGPCTIQLRARDEGDEVICLASDGVIIAPNQTTEVQLVLLCGI